MHTTEYHEHDPNLRVVTRGTQWFLQEFGRRAGSRTIDPWDDVSPPMDSREDGVNLMYSRKPKKPHELRQ